MANRAGDRLTQAIRDLDQAGNSRGAGRHEWACFAAQQAAEKGSKSHPEGPPFEHYGRLQSDEAVRYAREIVECVRSQRA